jgi:hypothetical protein
MLTDIKNHKLAYSLLALAAAGYLTLVYSTRTQPYTIVWATGIFAGFYALWGIFHHAVEHSLTFRVVLEYVLVATLAVTVVSTLLI